MIEVTVEEGRRPTLVVVGGSPKGGCPLHRTISKWPGWKRSRRKGSLSSGEPASIFEAPLYPHTALDLLKLDELGELSIKQAVRGVIERVALSIDHAKLSLADDKPPNLLNPPERELFTHQKQAVRAAVQMGYKILIADDMGLGKTTTALTCFQQSNAERLLVVCPASVKRNWAREAKAVLGEDIMVHLLEGTPAKRLKVFREMREHINEGGIAIINYDLLPHIDPGSEGHAVLQEWANYNMVILDESHYIKSKDAKRTKWVRTHLGVAYYRICLTGTPVRNMIDDLYCQADFLRPGFWSSYQDFCRRYLVQVKITMGNRSFFETKGTKNHAELNRLVNTFQIRRSKEDAFDLPPKVRTVADLELDDPSRRVYQAMKDFALLDLSELDADSSMFQPKAASAVEAALRCEQIAQGFVGGIPEAYAERVLPLLVDHAESIPGRPGEMIFPKSTKIKWLREKIDDILAQGGAPVVFSKYNAPLFWLAEQYPDFGFLHGGLNEKERDKAILDFQESRLAGMFCQVKIAEGFNLTRSHDVIFLGRDWSPAINAQAEDRCHRIGTTGTVNVQIPVMQKTIENHIGKRLLAKADDAEKAIKNLTVGQLREIL